MLTRPRLALAAALLAAVLAGCAGDDANGPANDGDGDAEVTIGFCMTLDHPYWQNMRLGAIDEGKKHGAEVIIMNAREDPVLQIQQIQELIARQVDLACVVPMKKEPLVAGVRALNEAGIPVIIVNREVAEGCDYLCYTGTDTYAGAVTSAGILMDAIGGEGGIVELHQHKGTGPQLLRSRALRDVMKKHPTVDLLASVPHAGDRGKAVKETQVLLEKYPDLKGIYAHGDNFAIAAADACRQAGRDDVAVVGMGGSREAIEAVKEGKITGTSYQQPEEEGRSAVRLAVRYLRGETLEPRYLIPCPAITRENADAFEGQF